MPGLSPNGQKSKQKKKAGRKRKRHAQKAPARKRSALKKVAVAEEKHDDGKDDAANRDPLSGGQTSDHPSDAELVDHARRAFKSIDRMRSNSAATGPVR